MVMAWSEGNAAAVSRHKAWKWESRVSDGSYERRLPRFSHLGDHVSAPCSEFIR